MCLWNVTPVHAYCKYVWSNTQTHAHWDQLLLTNGPSWWHNNGEWVRSTHNRERRKEEEQNRGTEKKEKNENQKWMRWSRVSIHEGGMTFIHRKQMMAWASGTLGGKRTDANNYLLNRFSWSNSITRVIINYIHTAFRTPPPQHPLKQSVNSITSSISEKRLCVLNHWSLIFFFVLVSLWKLCESSSVRAL